jgi:hypothetical protein
MAVASPPALAPRDWLLDTGSPVVRRLARTRLLQLPPSDPSVAELTAGLAADPWIAALLGARDAGHPYRKWIGAHWRLIALADLGVSLDVPGAEASIRDGFDRTVAWLLSASRLRRIRPINGRVRGCASQEGGALWAACRLGLGADPRTAVLAELLVARQWPDGGWNCDVRPAAAHSSFNESWQPLAGLAAFQRLAGGEAPEGLPDAIDRAAAFLLRHRVVESERTGELANHRLELLRWPPYWHYGLLPGLRALAEAGRLGEPEVVPAKRRLERLRSPDGRWRPDGRWWSSPGARERSDVLSWGIDGEARMLTLSALEILGPG